MFVIFYCSANLKVKFTTRFNEILRFGLKYNARVAQVPVFISFDLLKVNFGAVDVVVVMEKNNLPNSRKSESLRLRFGGI